MTFTLTESDCPTSMRIVSLARTYSGLGFADGRGAQRCDHVAALDEEQVDQGCYDDDEQKRHVTILVAGVGLLVWFSNFYGEKDHEKSSFSYPAKSNF